MLQRAADYDETIRLAVQLKYSKMMQILFDSEMK